jgi:acyl-CoA thioesterase
MHRFDLDTELAAVAPGRFEGHVHAGWSVGSRPNGGYLLALAVAALSEAVPEHPDPLSVTVHYLQPGLAGQPCTLEVEPLRSGRTLSTARARLIQDNATRVEVLASMGRVSAATAASELTIPPPDIPGPQACIGRSGSQQQVTLPLLDLVDVRLRPEDADGGSGRAEVSGWVRLRDGRAPDARACMLFADAFPPAVFGRYGQVGWVPTVQLSVQLRRQPSPGWILAQFRTQDLLDGRLIEDGLLWDEAGQLVAQVRQLALMRLADPAPSPGTGL